VLVVHPMRELITELIRDKDTGSGTAGTAALTPPYSHAATRQEVSRAYAPRFRDSSGRL